MPVIHYDIANKFCLFGVLDCSFDENLISLPGLVVGFSGSVLGASTIGLRLQTSARFARMSFS